MEAYVKNIGGTWFGIACEKDRVAASTFGENESDVLESLRLSLKFQMPLRVSTLNSFSEGALSAMKNIHDGNGTTDYVPLSMERLPTYTQRVLRTVSQIPLGYVTSYGGVAEAIGGGARAVGNAMANNPFAPFVPCHRVVSASLGLGGYGGGLRTKFDLLRRERQGFVDPKQIFVENGTLTIFPVEFVLEHFEKTHGQSFF